MRMYYGGNRRQVDVYVEGGEPIGGFGVALEVPLDNPTPVVPDRGWWVPAPEGTSDAPVITITESFAPVRPE